MRKRDGERGINRGMGRGDGESRHGGEEEKTWGEAGW